MDTQQGAPPMEPAGHGAPTTVEVLEPIFHVEFGESHENDRVRIGACVRGREAARPLHVLSLDSLARRVHDRAHAADRARASRKRAHHLVRGQVAVTVLAGQMDHGEMEFAYSTSRGPGW